MIRTVGKDDAEIDPHDHHGMPPVVPADLVVCEQAAAVFRALGDSNRMRLLSLLLVRELCVSEITAFLQDNLSTVSQRLRLLRSERIVASRREGKHIYYSLADEHVRQLIENALEHGQELD
jgi:DNA-binding transcriptional ArsR family regulator